MQELEARRRLLVARCEVERVELGERLAELRDSPLSRAAGELFGRGGPREATTPLARPLTWALALGGLLLLRRPREILTVLGWARTAVALGSRATVVLRLLEQLRPGRQARATKEG
jgi:hypothetical protein